MNVKLLFVFLSLLCISDIALGNIQSQNRRCKSIELKHDSHKKHRSVFISPFQAFSDGYSLSIEQDSSLRLISYTATIKDANTGESMFVQSAVGSAAFNLVGLLPGEYELEIETETMTLYGFFTIDDCSFEVEE